MNNNNNMSTSECSSGCESGWTAYLDQSTVSAYQYDNKTHWRLNVDYQNQETEDLSMVSDASSGPRYMFDDDDDDDDNSSAYFSASGMALDQKTKKQKNKIKGKKQEDAFLDDTASSHVIKNKLGHSMNQAAMGQETNEDNSATQQKGKSALKKHFGFLKSSVSGKANSQKSGGSQGRKWQ